MMRIPFASGRRLLPGLLLLAVAACTVAPTPFAPMGKDGYGYEEARLSDRVWRVAFRANPYTAETDVLDFLYLRSAELTEKEGFTHFLIENSFGRTQMGYRAADPRLGMGWATDPFWGGGLAAPPPYYYEGYAEYHVAVFIIRMLTADEAAKHEQAFDAHFIIESVRPKAERSRQREAS